MPEVEPPPNNRRLRTNGRADTLLVSKSIVAHRRKQMGNCSSWSVRKSSADNSVEQWSRSAWQS